MWGVRCFLGDSARAHVSKERERIQEKPVQEPKTALGKRIKAEMGAPTALVDQLVEDIGEDVLSKYEPDGEPN